MAHTTIVATAIMSKSPPSAFRPNSNVANDDSDTLRPPASRPLNRPHVSYGATTTHPVPALQVVVPSPRDELCDWCDDDDALDDAVDAALLNVSWRYMSRLYLLVPVVTLLFFAGLVALITWGWPPSEEERDEGQVYPHPFFWKAFLLGLFASITVQALRVPSFVAASWLCLSNPTTVIISTVFHAVFHEATRLISVPLMIPSPTSGFHSSFWLGLGWGIAEAAWGIVQAWEQLALYEDVLKPETDEEAWIQDTYDDEECLTRMNSNGLPTVPENEALDDDDFAAQEDVAELERRVEILERMRARHELEDVMGIPFPLIPFALHILWRLDTLLLNLGLTLILSAFWLDPEPIYRHDPDEDWPMGNVATILHPWPPAAPTKHPSTYLPLAWSLVALLHVVLALVWKVVGRVGVGAVTWGGLIVALGSVFAGLGAWGGLV